MTPRRQLTPRQQAAAGLAGAAGAIAVLTLLSRLAGFGRTLVFAGSVRAGGTGEVYTAVNTVPNVLFEVAAGGVLAAVAVPLVASHLGRGATEQANTAGSALLTWALTVLVPVGVVVALLAGPLAHALVGGSSVPGAGETGALMLRVFALQVPLYGVGIVLSGILHAHRRFLAVALAPLLSSLVVIATYLAYGARTGGATTAVGDDAVLLLAGGTTLGVLVLSVPLALPAWRAGFRWRPTWRLPAGDGRRAAHLAGGGLVALVAQQASVLATVWVATHRGGGGSLPVWGYLQAVYLLPYAVLAVPVATAAFPALAGAPRSQAPTPVPLDETGPDPEAVQPVSGRSEGAVLAPALRAVLVLSTLGAAVLVAVASPVEAFFTGVDTLRSGHPSGPALAALAEGLTACAPGLLGFGASALLLRAAYVHGSPLRAALAMAVGWLVAAIVPLATVPAAAGPSRTLVTIGVASSAGMTLAAVLLAAHVGKTWGRRALTGSLRTMCTAMLGGGLAAGCGLAVVRALGPGHGVVMPALVALVAAAVVAVVLLAVMWVGDRATVATVLRGRR